jgi:hypothetical protein
MTHGTVPVLTKSSIYRRRGTSNDGNDEWHPHLGFTVQLLIGREPVVRGAQKNVGVGLKRLPCSSFLQRAIKMFGVKSDNFEVGWAPDGPFLIAVISSIWAVK